jgi:hypothetical protein
MRRWCRLAAVTGVPVVVAAAGLAVLAYRYRQRAESNAKRRDGLAVLCGARIESCDARITEMTEAMGQVCSALGIEVTSPGEATRPRLRVVWPESGVG